MPMKKALLFTCMMIFLGSAAWSQDSDLFSYDRDAVTTALSDLDEAESYVTGHPGITLSEIRSSDELSGTHLVKLSPVDGSSLAGEPPLGIPSFWWGCIFGVVGIALVYFIAEDAEETKKALMGCVAWTVAWVVFYLVYWLVVGATLWSYY